MQLKFSSRSSFSSLLLAGVCLAAGQQGANPEISYERTFQTPYMYQKNPRYEGDGSVFCAPTSSAMGLAWLSTHGYPKLIPNGQNQKDSLQRIVELLASEDYMNTGLKTGTHTNAVIEGLNRYVTDAGYRVHSFEYEGIRPPKSQVPCQFVGDKPAADLLRKGVDSPSAFVLLNVGYYNRVGSAWRRMNGHWVLAVGYGANGTGHVSDNAILIHNPALGLPKDLAPKSDLPRRLSADVALLTPITGNILDARNEIMRTMDGLFTIEGPAIRKSKRFDATVLEGIVVVTLEPPQS